MHRYVLVFVALSLAACQKPASDEAQPSRLRAPTPGGGTVAQSNDELSTPLAKVGDVTITVGDLEDQLDRQSPYIRARYTSTEQKKAFLQSLIRFEVLAAEAEKRGYDKNPEVVRTMKSVMVQKLLEREFDTATVNAVSDADIKAYYDANSADYVRPEEVRVAAIIVKNKTQATKIATLAAGEAGKTNKGFRALVDQYSTDEQTKLRGGDLRFFPKVAGTGGADVEQPPQPVAEAAFALAGVGDVSSAIDAGNGTFYVIKETGHRHSTSKSLDEVKEAIRIKLARDQRLKAEDKLAADLEAKTSIQVDEDNLAKVRIDTSSQEAADPRDIAPPPPPPNTP
jgi:peptidyl-prolyl cis-trans isomerase C